MKLKLLLMPSIIALSIILLIWLVYPAYSNGADGLKERYNQLDLEKKKLSDIENKSLNIAKLSDDLSNLSEDREFIEKFLPENIEEEEIIDNLNFLANSSGLSVLDISVEKLKKVEKVSAGAEDQTATSPDSEGFTGDDILAAPLPKPEKFNIGIRLAGNYINIKVFLDKLEKLGRYNDISSLEIAKVLGEKTGEEGQNPDILSVNAGINFSTLEKATVSYGMINDPIFAQSNLNVEIVSGIKNIRTTELLKLDVGAKGKTNIFIP